MNEVFQGWLSNPASARLRILPGGSRTRVVLRRFGRDVARQ